MSWLLVSPDTWTQPLTVLRTSNHLANILLRDEDGRRAAYGSPRKFQEAPQWRVRSNVDW
jgi:hypothetical protein